MVEPQVRDPPAADVLRNGRVPGCYCYSYYSRIILQYRTGALVVVVVVIELIASGLIYTDLILRVI